MLPSLRVTFPVTGPATFSISDALDGFVVVVVGASHPTYFILGF
jgi:hypothetical protein